MKTIINKKGYGILKTSLTEEETEQLKESLTVKPLVIPDYDFGKNEEFAVYRYNSTRFYVPKYWGIKNYGEPDHNDETEELIKIEHHFNGTLKKHQIEFTKRLLNEISENGSCIACMQTGGGKTICALWLIAQLKKRTLIVVHKEFLMDQWIERIKQFLPNASIGIIKQNKAEIDNDIVIGMIQSITMHKYPDNTFDSFSFCILDECHHLSSRTFSKLLYIVGSKYKLGLSATPKRKDGLTKVLEWFLGDIIINHLENDIETPIVKCIDAKYSSELKPKYNFKKKLVTANMETQIADDKGRTKQVVEEIIKLANEGRKILVLSSRRNHCEEMKDLIKDKDVGLYLGGMTEKELQNSNKANIILATYSMAHEGYDNPDLDTLVMATGRGDIEQACGRILRKRNENRPLIIDFNDEYFEGQANRRKMFYKKKGYINFETNKPFKIKNQTLEIPDECLLD